MRNSKKSRVRMIVLTVLVLIVGALWAFSTMIYNDNINQRFESYKPLMFKVEDFEGLKCTNYKFPSDKGQMLMGYWYSAGSKQRGIIILTHGFGGGGHNSYMDCINYFAQHGYYVFAYDATGNDESDGEGVGGFPRGTNSSSDIFEVGGKEEAGNFIGVMMPFVKIHEWLNFGKYATNTAMDGFQSSDAAILVAHSEDDKTVPINGILSTLIQ